MRKSIIYTILTMTVLLFLWWFTGGTLMSYVRPSPAEEAAKFALQNFQVGLATVFEALLR